MKIWNVLRPDRDIANEIADGANISEIAALVLASRGVEDSKSALKFLAVQSELADPFLIKDMDVAVLRILQAIEDEEKICIYGDYDADGVCSTALLYSYLSNIGADVFYYIPSRQTDGYGMNIGAIDKIASQGTKLIVTVDNGILAIDETDYAVSLGIDVIITDHHKPSDVLPQASAVVDPHRLDCSYPFKDLCGVGVAFKLVSAISGDVISQEDLLCEYADLLAVGTIGDVVPLVNENRLFVQKGLELLKDMPRPGIKALLDICGIDPNKINSGRIAYLFVPRINACGRLGLAQTALNVILSENEEEAHRAALKLEDDNTQRRNIEHDIFQQARDVIDRNSDLRYKSIIVVSGQGWNSGVVGIVASRLCELYGKPVIIIGVNDGVGRGSGRSISGFSLVDAVFSCKSILTNYGGHPMAVGVTIEEKNIDKFTDMINDYADSIGELPYPVLNVDLKLNPSRLSVDLVRGLECLQPYGAGNLQPLFGLYNMKISGISEVGGGKHLRLSVCRDEHYITAMYFSHSKDDFIFRLGDSVDLAVTLDINEYNGKQSVSVVVRDIKLSEEKTDEYLQSLRIYEKISINKNLNNQEIMSIFPKREEFARVYREIKKQRGSVTSISKLCCTIGDMNISYGKIKVIIEALAELSLIDYETNCDLIKIQILQYDGKVDLTKAPIMLKIQSALNGGE